MEMGNVPSLSPKVHRLHAYAQVDSDVWNGKQQFVVDNGEPGTDSASRVVNRTVR